MKPKIVYLVQMNLSGLYKEVIKMHFVPDFGTYWDSTGDLEYLYHHRVEDGITQLVFKKESEAKAALRGAKMVGDFLKERL